MREIVLCISGGVSLLAALCVVTHRNAVHALLYLIVSLLAAAMMFFALGAPLAAALEVIVYAGAIMVLFVFVVMLLNVNRESIEQERQWGASPKMWVGPLLLSLLLFGQLAFVILLSDRWMPMLTTVGPKEVGMALFGKYVWAVEAASMLLLAGLIGALHLGHGAKDVEESAR